MKTPTSANPSACATIRRMHHATPATLFATRDAAIADLRAGGAMCQGDNLSTPAACTELAIGVSNQPDDDGFWIGCGPCLSIACGEDWEVIAVSAATTSPDAPYAYACWSCGRKWSHAEPAPPEPHLPTTHPAPDLNEDLCGNVQCVGNWLQMNPELVPVAAPWRPQNVIDAALVLLGMRRAVPLEGTN